MYASLQPGRYRFEVKSLGWNGGWSSPSFFSFGIKPPYWRTAWFFTVLGLAILMLLYFFFRYRILQLVKLQKEKLKLQQVRNEQLKEQLEMEKIINFFTTSLASKNTKEEVIRDVAKNLIHQLGFANCMIYLWNEDKTVLLQKAGYGPNGFLEDLEKEQFRVELWQGIVGHVAATKKPVLVDDTSKDSRYRSDVLTRYSELAVPAMYNDELIGVIDSEDFERNYYTPRHLQILSTIATLMAAKLTTIEADEDIRRKKEQIGRMNEQLTQSELASLRSQMNPHFLFNSLSSIHKYIWENRQEDASEYLTKFSRLIRMILENSKEKTIPLSVEIEMLHLYIELEHRRCNGKFNYRLTVENSLDTTNIAVPSMIIQPYIENAIWHGLVPKDNPGELIVTVARSNEKLECCIEDDGIGREVAKAIKDSKQDKYMSLGMDITRKRLELMSRVTGETASVTIIDKKNKEGLSSGTKVILYLPFTTLY
jgi:putative methionine-R-sulfoxide reductase with GAF domain/anti-sigma regulatory factor (Ser/Thr protein kinase)